MHLVTPPPTDVFPQSRPTPLESKPTSTIPGSPVGTPPPAPPPIQVPEARPVVDPVGPTPPVSSAPVSSAPVSSQASNGTSKPVVRQPARSRAVPPPPPVRATLPPVRPAPPRPAQPVAGARVSGVGSARVGRWSDDRPTITDPTSRVVAATASAETDPDAATSPEAERDWLQRAAAAPSWLISTVLHLILLLILALITTPMGAGVSRVLLTIGQSERESPVELTEFSIDANDVVLESESMVDSEVNLETESILFDVNSSLILPIAGDSSSSDSTSESVTVSIGATDITIDKPMFGGRSGAMKKALLAIYGGTAQTEDAVQLGLQWLKAQQLRNGSWSMRGPYGDPGTSENHTAATAMAMLAFMGAGNTHQSGDYAKELERAVKWLVGEQDRSGFMAKDARDHERMYAQAQATIALCELYAMTGDSWLRPRAQLALDFGCESQSPEGGWRYQPRFDSDTSVTGWFVMALKSGVSAGLEIDSQAFYRVNRFLDSVQHFEGAGYSYQQRGNPSPPMTAEGLLCRQYLGWPRAAEPMRAGLETLVDAHPITMNDRDVYYWYYATQALHHYGGDLWKRWNNVMRVELPASQVKSGAEKGSWSPQNDAWGGTAGRLYTTCLSIYCLEVYYRHMPLYDPSGE